MMATFWMVFMLIAVGVIANLLDKIHRVLEADRRDRQDSDSWEERIAAARFMREVQDRANAAALISSPNVLAEEQIKKR